MTAMTLVGTSAWTNGAQNPQPTYPAGLVQGDVVYLIAVSRASTVSVNILTGWSFVGDATGGGGTEAAGTGPTRVSVLKRTIPSGWTDGQTVATGLFTGTNAAVAHVRAYRGPSSTATFAETFTSYSNSSASTTVGGTGGGGLALATDDVLLTTLAGPDDAVTAYTVSGVTASGATLSAATQSPTGTFGTPTGNDLAMLTVTQTVTAGSSSSAPVVSATADASETSMGFLMRVRTSLNVSGDAARNTVSAATVTAAAATPPAVSRQTVATVVASAGIALSASQTTTAAATVAAALAAAADPPTTVATGIAAANKQDLAGTAQPTFSTSRVDAVRIGFANPSATTTAAVSATAFLLVGVRNHVTTATATVTGTERRPDFGTIRVGRLTLTETISTASEGWSGDVRTLAISGQESCPPLTQADLNALVDDLQNLQDTLVPVGFMWKQDRDGYYVVSSVSADMVNWGNTCITVDWKLQLARAGADGEVDIESRLSGPQTRTNTHATTGERWHAPPIGATAYWTGTTQPSTMTRPTTDGDITVYRGLPTSVSPRYDVPAASYMLGRARIVDRGRERTGVQWKTTPGGWELSNGLVKASLVSLGATPATTPGPSTFPGPFLFPGSGQAGTVLRLEAWTLVPISLLPDRGYGVVPYGTVDYGEPHGITKWTGKDWTVLLNGSAISAPTACSILRNDPECVSVRILWSGAPAGRTTADLTLRRGSRLLEMFLRTSFSSTLKVARARGETATPFAGYLRSAVDDNDGNRYVLGSAGDYTADIVSGGISKTATTSLDAFLAVEMHGSGAAQGDQAGQLYRQYLGAPSELTAATRR